MAKQAVYEKGTRNEIEDFIYDICDVNGDGILLSKRNPHVHAGNLRDYFIGHEQIRIEALAKIISVSLRTLMLRTSSQFSSLIDLLSART
ncbi:hypothetical protein HPP92_023054 [Vanilla planifolia]|uniref:Uncharacterized protein n=1 Tax=Vanilla planifolia TaxID=51239 RepID=A0A835UDS2_VANPL|nr:hypothetical protein HPP92_023054 [Vanilla planifolia]